MVVLRLTGDNYGCLKLIQGEIISKTFNVPSLFFSNSLEGRFEDEELQQILDDIQTKRSFQY